MRRIVNAVLVASGFTACAPQPMEPVRAHTSAPSKTQEAEPTMRQPTVLERREELDAHLNELVTLRGEVANSKIPTILGVDVSSNEPDLRGQEAEATGILIRWTVTREELDAAIAKHGMFAHRGPGVFYRLKAPDSEADAQVQPPAAR